MAILQLRQRTDVSGEQIPPVPLKLEVTFLGEDNPKPSVTPPAQPQAAKPKPEPKPEPKPKSKPKPETGKKAAVKEKLPDLGEIERLIKSQSVKPVSKSVKSKPGQQTVQSVSSSMVMPQGGKSSVRDNFPVSDIHNPSPEYPEMAIFLGYQGNAIVRIKVSAQGLSKGVEILRSSGHKILDESTIKALRKWRFTPGKQGNAPMAGSVIISVFYVLYEKKAD